MTKIAVIEDDILLNRVLAICLQKEGYEVLQGYTCREGLGLIKQNPNLVLLDRMLPDGDGINLCRQEANIRKMPVLFLTARDEENDMIDAFDAGCEDYVVKPFSMDVLKRRIAVILRRNLQKQNVFVYQDLVIDFAKKSVLCGESPVKLTAKEYHLLEYMAKNSGQVLTKEMLLEKLWDAEGKFVEENTLFVTINRLRKKIEPDVSHPEYIKNIFGMGYLFGDMG